MTGDSVVNQERPWLSSYPASVPAEIDLEQFPSIVSVLESSFEQFRDRSAYTNLGKTLSYDEVDNLSRQFAEIGRAHV